MRQTQGMRTPTLLMALLSLGLAAGACRPSKKATTPSDGLAAKPGDDLTLAGDQPGKLLGDGEGDDRRLGGDAGPKVVDLDVIHLDVVGTDADGEAVIEASTPGPLLDRGNKAFADGKLDEAIGWYRKLATEFPDSGLAPAALYNIALAHEKRGELDEAVRAYLEVAKAYPASTESLDGGLRAAAILADRRKWAEAVVVLDTVLTRNDLSRELRLEAQARKGYAQLELDQLDEAEATLTQAVETWRKASRIEDPYYIAMARFYLGEIEHRRFERAPLRSADEELSADMATRRALVMRAYNHWKEALKFKEAYWATASGYQMSEIFYEYWKAAVHAPFPDGMEAQARPLYVKEVHDRVRENLVKALEGHQANVGLSEAYGVDNGWSAGSKTRTTELLRILDREARGEAVVP